MLEREKSIDTPLTPEDKYNLAIETLVDLKEQGEPKPAQVREAIMYGHSALILRLRNSPDPRALLISTQTFIIELYHQGIEALGGITDNPHDPFLPVKLQYNAQINHYTNVKQKIAEHQARARQLGPERK